MWSQKKIDTVRSIPVRYVLVGGANTVFGLLVIFLVKGIFEASDVIANMVGYGAGFAVSFILNGRWTFSGSVISFASAVRYAVVVLCAYLGNLSTVLWLLRIDFADSYVCQAIGIAPYTVMGYFGSKWFAFREAKRG